MARASRPRVRRASGTNEERLEPRMRGEDALATSGGYITQFRQTTQRRLGFRVKRPPAGPVAVQDLVQAFGDAAGGDDAAAERRAGALEQRDARGAGGREGVDDRDKHLLAR